MKVCSKCGQAFSDDTLRFCLTDGTPLIDSVTQPTITMPAESIATAVAPRQKHKRNPILWVVAVLAMVVIGSVLLAGIIAVSYRMGRESAKPERNQAANTATSPKPSSPNAEPSPDSVPSAVPTSNADAETGPDEVTPISWTTAGVGFKQDAGTTYRFHCPEKGTPGVVWGNDIYTADSSICTAAVHAGVITIEKGGDVRVEFKPGRSIYGSTTRNGITSNTFGEYPHSFVVR